jgi:putative SOS response-associated peptidase YedK
MCGGVEFRDGEGRRRVYFPQPGAALPVRRRDGSLSLVPWGRRENENIDLPRGGWARLESIRAGKWRRYRPRPVLIAVERFMEKDRSGRSHWYAVPPGYSIQGLLAHDGDEQRVYVVTTAPPGSEAAAVHDRWPRLVTKLEE